MYKQLSDVYLNAAQAYAKLAEVEAIALENKRVAEEAQAKVAELSQELELADKHSDALRAKAADYERIYRIFMAAEISDFINIRNDVSDIKIEVEDDEVAYAKAVEYQNRLKAIATDMLNIRIGFGE